MVRKPLRVVDLFCGAGGSTTGAVAAGLDVVMAVNHWRTAIYSHQANYPGTRHICARIEQIDVRNDRTLPNFDVLIASPECTHHSIARGGRPVSDQSRQQPFALLDWVDAKRPRAIVVENVREFLDWGPLKNTGTERKPEWQPDKTRKGDTFRGWINAIQSIGYGVEYRILNAADYGEATNRSRLFVIAKLGGGEITFPEPTHAGRWRSAAEIIDWTRPCKPIYSRKRALAGNTIHRISVGIRKFGGTSLGPVRFLTHYYGTGGASSVDEPLATVTTKDRFGLVVVSGTEIGFRMLDVDELSAAMGFPRGYCLHGTRSEQVRQLGNAVCPGVMRAICETISA